MKQTEGGKVTDEYLDQLEKWANMYPKAWTMGIGSYAMAAIVIELRDLRRRVKALEGTKGKDS